MSYPSSPSGTSSSSSSSSDLATPSPSPILSLAALDSLSLSPVPAIAPATPVHIVCNAPLVAPVPLPYHSPTFLQFDLPDLDADLSRPPYTRSQAKSLPASPSTGKRKRKEHDLEHDADLTSTAVPDYSMLLLPPPSSINSYGGAPAAKRRRSFPAPFFHPQLQLHRSTQLQQQQQRALRHAISFSHSLSRRTEIPVSSCSASRTHTGTAIPQDLHPRMHYSQLHAFGHPYSSNLRT